MNGPGAEGPPTDLSGAMRMSSSPAAILDRNPLLKSLFLSRPDLHPGSPRTSPLAMMQFLLWFAVEGKAAFPDCARFCPAYCALLDAPGPDGESLLASYVLGDATPPGRAGTRAERRLARFCFVEVPAHGLMPLLAPGWLAALGEAVPGCAATRLMRLLAVHRGAEAPLRDPGGGALRRWWEEADRDEPVLRQVAVFQGAPPPESDLPGVTIAGFARHALGIGEDARALARVLRSRGVPVSFVDVGGDEMEPVPEAALYGDLTAPSVLFPVVVFCAPPFETARILARGLVRPLEGRHRIGSWPWELTELPAEWHHAFALVDEVWASSRFLAEVYRPLTARPVVHMPMLVDVAGPEPFDREAYGIGRTDFLVLAMADFHSSLTRKNVSGAVAAFQAAFPDDPRAHLLVKSTHLVEGGEAWARLEGEIGDDPRVTVLDGALSRGEVCGIVAEADVFLSLHRSEGFGRVLAEAMLLGTPVVATDWSGSTDILDGRTGYPVGYRLRPVEPGEYPEGAGHWAEPDLVEAAARLREVRQDGRGRARKVALARSRTGERFGIEAVAERVTARLREIADEGGRSGDRPPFGQ